MFLLEYYRFSVLPKQNVREWTVLHITILYDGHVIIDLWLSMVLQYYQNIKQNDNNNIKKEHKDIIFFYKNN